MSTLKMFTVSAAIAALGLAACAQETATSSEALSATASSASALAAGQNVRVRLGADSANLAATYVAIGGGHRHGDAGGRIRGPISAIDAAAGTLTVFGSAVVTSTSTELRGVDTLDALAVGDIVEVSGAIDANGAIAADHLHAFTPAISGTIDAVTSDATTGDVVITILGRTITVAADTEVVEHTAPAEGAGRGGHGGHGGRGGHGDGGE